MRRYLSPHPDQGHLFDGRELWPWKRLFDTFELTRLQKLTPNTQRCYRSTFRAVLERFGPDALPDKSALLTWLAERVKRRELMASSANVVRNHLAQVFKHVRDDHDAQVLNAANFEPFPVPPQKHEGLKDPQGTWLKLKAAMPDTRAVCFLAVMLYLGLRRSEALGLEWRHLRWEAKDGPELLVEQQRDAGEAVPAEHGRKHRAPKKRFPLVHPELLKLLRATKALVKMGGEPLFGCRRGPLVGQVPAKDGQVRSFIFPYRDDHVQELANLLHTAAPEEFPRGVRGVKGNKSFHRFRHAFCQSIVETMGDSENGKQMAQELMGHKDDRTTSRYYLIEVGTKAKRDALEAVAKAQSELRREEPAEEEVPQTERRLRAISSRGKSSSPQRKTRQ